MEKISLSPNASLRDYLQFMRRRPDHQDELEKTMETLTLNSKELHALIPGISLVVPQHDNKTGEQSARICVRSKTLPNSPITFHGIRLILTHDAGEEFTDANSVDYCGEEESTVHDSDVAISRELRTFLKEGVFGDDDYMTLIDALTLLLVANRLKHGYLPQWPKGFRPDMLKERMPETFRFCDSKLYMDECFLSKPSGCLVLHEDNKEQDSKVISQAKLEKRKNDRLNQLLGYHDCQINWFGNDSVCITYLAIVRSLKWSLNFHGFATSETQLKDYEFALNLFTKVGQDVSDMNDLFQNKYRLKDVHIRATITIVKTEKVIFDSDGH